MAKSKRVDQVAGQIQEILGQMIQREIKDPRLGFVTVMAVHLSPDLFVANVNVSVLGDPEVRTASLATLERAKGFLRRELGRELQLRQVPELHFHLDTTLDARAHMDELFRDIDAERRENPPLLAEED